MVVVICDILPPAAVSDSAAGDFLSAMTDEFIEEAAEEGEEEDDDSAEEEEDQEGEDEEMEPLSPRGLEPEPSEDPSEQLDAGGSSFLGVEASGGDDDGEVGGGANDMALHPRLLQAQLGSKSPTSGGGSNNKASIGSERGKGRRRGDRGKRRAEREKSAPHHRHHHSSEGGGGSGETQAEKWKEDMRHVVQTTTMVTELLDSKTQALVKDMHTSK